MKNFILLLILSFVAGCVSNPSIPTSKMGATLQYTGFAVKRPSNSRWYLDTNEQNKNIAIFRMNIASPTHTLLASIGRHSIPYKPKSIEELQQIVKSQKTSGKQSRFKLISYESETGKIQGLWSIKYKVKTIDSSPRNSTKNLILTQHGFVVLHPNWSNTVINAEYSERGIESEIGKEYEIFGKKLIEGVEIQSASGVAFSG